MCDFVCCVLLEPRERGVTPAMWPLSPHSTPGAAMRTGAETAELPVHLGFPHHAPTLANVTLEDLARACPPPVRLPPSRLVKSPPPSLVPRHRHDVSLALHLHHGDGGDDHVSKRCVQPLRPPGAPRASPRPLRPGAHAECGEHLQLPGQLHRALHLLQEQAPALAHQCLHHGAVRVRPDHGALHAALRLQRLRGPLAVGLHGLRHRGLRLLLPGADLALRAGRHRVGPLRGHRQAAAGAHDHLPRGHAGHRRLRLLRAAVVRAAAGGLEPLRPGGRPHLLQRGLGVGRPQHLLLQRHHLLQLLHLPHRGHALLLLPRVHDDSHCCTQLRVRCRQSRGQTQHPSGEEDGENGVCHDQHLRAVLVSLRHRLLHGRLRHAGVGADRHAARHRGQGRGLLEPHHLRGHQQALPRGRLPGHALRRPALLPAKVRGRQGVQRRRRRQHAEQDGHEDQGDGTRGPDGARDGRAARDLRADGDHHGGLGLPSQAPARPGAWELGPHPHSGGDHGDE